MFDAIHRNLHRFARDERASLTVEMVMVLPLLLWGYFGMFVLFDGYRAIASNIRAGYTIADMISRQDVVDAAFIEGLNGVQDVLTQSPYRTVLRVSAVSYYEDQNDDPGEGEFQLDWSYSTAGKNKVNNGNFDELLEPYMPAMGPASVNIVVETWMAFVPLFEITNEKLFCEYNDSCGEWDYVFPPLYFESLVVTRLRYYPQICFDNGQQGCT